MMMWTTHTGWRAGAAGEDPGAGQDRHSDGARRAVGHAHEVAAAERQDQGRAGRREPREKTAREARQAEGEAAARRGGQRASQTRSSSSRPTARTCT